MANANLLPIYQELFEESFDYGRFDHRMNMQKAVYLLQEMGVPVGDYGFRWYLHGPYCQTLQDDMFEESFHPSGTPELPTDYLGEIRNLHALIASKDRGSYNTVQWLECLGSTHYLMNRVLSPKAAPADVTEALQSRKAHLADVEANTAAYNLLKGKR